MLLTWAGKARTFDIELSTPPAWLDIHSVLRL